MIRLHVCRFVAIADVQHEILKFSLLLGSRAWLPLGLSAAGTRGAFLLLQQLLGVIQVLLDSWPSLLGDLSQLALALLFNRLQRRQHIDMRMDDGAQIALIKLRTL